jgi:hypothetical protein
MKIGSVATELFHADRWTDGQRDMTKLMVAFYNFGKRACNRSYGNQNEILESCEGWDSAG